MGAGELSGPRWKGRTVTMRVPRVRLGLGDARQGWCMTYLMEVILQLRAASRSFGEAAYYHFLLDTAVDLSLAK